MSNNIKLVNENGKIVGKDPDTGETIPVEMESLSTESIGINVGQRKADLIGYLDADTLKLADNRGLVQYSGSDHGSTINEAFANEGAGTHIHLSSGTYVIHPDRETAIELHHDDQTLSGSGPDTVIESDDVDYSGYGNETTAFVWAMGVETPSLLNLKIDGRWEANSGGMDTYLHENVETDNTTNLRVKWVKSVNAPGDGIDLDGGDEKADISNSWFENCRGFGVHFSGSDNCSVSDSVAVNCGHDGGGDNVDRGLRAGFDQNPSATGCRLDNLLVVACGNGLNVDGQDMNVSNVTILNPTQHGIRHREGGGNHNLSNVTIRGAGEYGIDLRNGCAGTKYSGLDIIETGDIGVYAQDRSGVENFVIDDFYIEDCGAESFRFYGTDSKISNGTIVGCGPGTYGDVNIRTTNVKVSNVDIKESESNRAVYVDDVSGLVSFDSVDVFDTVDGTDWVIHSDAEKAMFDGVQGGGPIGGIDLSAEEGRYDGVTAMSDGTATGFPTGTLATWGGSQWVRADGQESVTPS